MSLRQGISLLLACAAAIACGGEAVVQPTPNPPSVGPSSPPAPVFSSIGISPDSLAIDPGEAVPLVVRPLDQHGRQMDFLPSVAWSSSSPEIATVSGGGVVRGVSPGTVSISATATFFQVSRTAAVSVRILPVPAFPNLALASGSRGWEPSVAYMRSGGSAEWRIGQTSWSGVAVTWIWLMDDQYSVVDSIDVRSGSAKRAFYKPGVVNYCTAGCWDPPDFGKIFVQ